jgi:cyclic pyranopterin phosphate synthase
VAKKITRDLKGMVDVGAKKETRRTARAQAFVRLKSRVLNLIKEKKAKKGDVLEQARVAGIMAAKKTNHLIPLCHPLRIADVSIDYAFEEGGIRIISEVSAIERTGVEMEALTACAVSALTIYDMCKMYDRSMEITDVLLLEKRGGKSGTYKRKKR